MTTPLERLQSGYYNSDPVSATNPGGFDDDGHEINFPAALADIAAVTAVVAGLADAAAAQVVLANAAAASAANAPGTKSTSISSINLGTLVLGTAVNLAINEAGKAYAVGQSVVWAVTADPAKQFSGVITAFDATAKTMTVVPQYKSGTGTFAAWTVAITAPIDTTLTGRVTALETEIARLKSRLRLTKQELL
ncbi:hypothetical protein [Caulobacter sp. BP25]|uniref:hypothetical protein n=1 Tax=Caulobacter sp. BP25 TaxID=2048900 RepID=UPI000C12B0A8|nr:hypothetical protein [Caulobacter sp. BP25]PHY20821.1 hypothetical protein CSW59_06245 [Caulobacter sp. BP25]